MIQIVNIETISRVFWRKVNFSINSIVQCLDKQNEQSQIYKRLIIQRLYMAVRDEKEWENLNDTGPSHPKMTWIQGKALVFLIEMDKKMSGIIDDFRNLIHDFLLSKRDGMNQYKLNQLANVSRFLLILSRFKGNFL